MYPQDLIEAVLKHADIVQVVSSYIPVEKHGRSHLSICPFHDDKNPSMNISSEKQIFKCFSCGAGGNAIGFVQRYEKIPFGEAVRKVAQLSNYNDPRLVDDAPKVKVDASKSRLYDCINDLQAYYRYGLAIPEGEAARNYLLGRDIGTELWEKYGIGYAPRDGQTTVKFLQAKGHSLKAIDDIGVALARGEGTSDHNAGRVIFPLCDPNGQVVGFSARRIVNDDTPKYVNSPDGVLFHKGSVLYNYHRAADAARHAGYCYLVEGFMDVMALDRAGIGEAVALMGTALTPEQIRLLRKLRCEVRLSLDGDGPGQGAMMKASLALADAGIRFRVVDYAGDLRDPDEILRQDGAQALFDKLQNLIEPVDFQIAYYARSKRLGTPEEKKKALAAFLPYLRSKPPGIEYEDTLVKLSDATGYSPEAIRTLAQREQGQEAQGEEGIKLTAARATPRDVAPPSKLELAERTLLRYMLSSPDALRYYESQVGNFVSESLFATIAEFLIEFAAGHGGNIDTNQLLAYIAGSGVENAERIGEEVSTLALQEGLPSCTRKTLEDLGRVIREETESLRDKTAAQKAISSGNLESGAAANAELAKKIAEKFRTKRSGKGN